MSIQHKELSGDELHQPMRKGNDADKASSPVAGDWFLALDTEKIYVCYDGGVWGELSPVDIDGLIKDGIFTKQDYDALKSVIESNGEVLS